MLVEIKGMYMNALYDHNAYINFTKTLSSEDIFNISLLWIELRRSK